MKTLHKLILAFIALVGLAMATPAQAYWHHYRRHVVYVGPGYGYYDPYYYGPYYGGYYARPYYGPHFTISFGGHGYYHRGYFHRW